MHNPRQIAVEMLDKVLDKKWFVDDCFERDERINSLEQRDRNFVRAMVMTTLRFRGEIDHFLHGFTREPDNINRLAVAQLKFMRMPAHAVVNEMVKIAPKKGFTNASLRTATTEKLKRNIRINFPRWMLGSWEKAYGREVVDKIVPIMLYEPPLDLTLKAGATLNKEHQVLPNGSCRVKSGGDITEIGGYAEGNWWVQDASSAMAVTLLGDVKGKRVLDMCAAPGGKTAQLCDMGAIVTAADDSQRRLMRLKENMERLGFEPEIICADGRKMEGEYDAILLDAPCTATGTISKNPEILNSRTIDDVKEMVKLQRELIDNAHKMLKSGGVLVYATCSLQYEEGEGLVKKLDATQWKLEEQKRILPTEFLEFGGTSGFYCAKLVRV